MEPNSLMRTADLVALMYCALLIGVGIWAFRGRLPATIKAKYSSLVTYRSQLPFAYDWRQAVSADDLPAFERARIRQHVFLIVISSLILLIALYAYLNAAAMLRLCQMHGAGLR
jgi:hypothetical protein